MLAKRVIPCLDVTDGRVVKGTNFVDLRDAGDPVELAARYDAEGADELVFLDITASSDARDTMVDVVYRTAALRAGARARRDRDRLAVGLDPAVEGDDDQAAIGDGERHEPAPEHALLRRGDEAAQLLTRLQGGGHVRSRPVVELGHDVSRWRPS